MQLSKKDEQILTLEKEIENLKMEVKFSLGHSRVNSKSIDTPPKKYGTAVIIILFYF